ncbi:MAG: GEVED domain-containing protein, partial [Bacteroidota bacterium]
TAGTYSVTVTDANGCSGTSADVVVTENANPIPVISGSTTYCASAGSTTLDAGSGFASYLWSPGGETTQTISATAGTYSVTVTDANGCSGTSADVIVTENANPTPVIAGATDYCEGSNTTLDAGSGFSSYLWSPGGETTQTISATAGTYSVTVTDANGCSGTSADVVVTENANPIPVISGSTTYCASAGSTTLEAGSVFASYLWSPGGETTQTISATAGTYSVTVTDANGCSGTSADVVVTETTPASWYLDADGDGFGDPNSSIVACDPPSGFVSDGTDCDDQEEFSFPGNPEICDGIDNNCDGNIDEGVCSSYCSSSGLDSQYEWIEKVEIGTISNQSGNDGGYADYTSISTDLPIGRSEFVTLTPGFSNGAFKEHWRIWIDLNHDGDFDDTGERVFQKASFYPINYLFTIPATATPGPTRMRVSMRFNKKPNACQNFPFGEVEDYTVNLVVPPCGALPTDWYSQDIGNAAHPGSACYDPTDGSFSVSSAGKDIYGKKDKFHFAYTDLCGDGEIIARVQDIMPTGAFAFAGIMMRESTSTFSKNVAMLKRTNGNVLFQSRFTTAGLTSSAQSSASLPGWIKLTRTGNTFVGYVSQDGVSWTVTYSSTVHMANCLTVGLAVSSNYTRLVNTSVFDNVSVNPLGGARRTNTHQAATVMTEGSTHPKETREEAALIDKDPQLMVLQATVYPNPTQEEAFLECQAIGRLSGTLEIYSIMGQLVYETSFEPTSTATLALPVSSLSSGVYVVKLKLEDNRSLEKRLVVSQ